MRSLFHFYPRPLTHRHILNPSNVASFPVPSHREFATGVPDEASLASFVHENGVPSGNGMHHSHHGRIFERSAKESPALAGAGVAILVTTSAMLGRLTTCPCVKLSPLSFLIVVCALPVLSVLLFASNESQSFRVALRAMAFTVLQILTSLSLLSLINAIPYDQAHYEQQEDIDLPDTSHSSPNLAKAKGKATESSNFPTIVRPTPFNSRVLGYSGASTDATPPKGPQQEPYGTGPYSGPQQSIPHHSSSIAGPTASYGTATSSGNDYSFPQQPINGSSDGLSRPSNCSSASFITVPPITVTVTSTVSANPGPLPAIIPTVTRTITTTVCLASGQHTDLGGSGDSSLPETSTVNSYSSVSHGAVNLDQGYGQANRSLGIQEPYVSYQNSATIASDEGQVPTNTQMMPNLSTSQGGGPNVPSGSNLDQGGSRDVSLGNTTTPPYGFNNDTSSETGSETGSYVLETKTGVTSAPAMPEPLPQYDRGGNDISSTVPYTVSNVVPPIATGAGSFATPALINSATSVPGTEVSYQPPSGTGPAAPGNGATDYIGSDPCGNGGCKNLQEYCDAVRRNGQSDPKCNPELPPSPTTPGNGGIDYIGSDPCGNGGCKSLQEYCSAVRRNGQSDSKCDSELSPPLTTSLPLYQPPSDTGVVYTTMTQEVVPYPIEPAPDNVPSPSISQPQILSPGVLVPNTSSSTTSEELLPTPAPSFPTTALADKPIPPPSSPPSPSGVNSTTTDPPCIPSTENKLITVDVSPPQALFAV
ncbi:MAG: hypothetical protein L6R40_002460 [Gallowayella cf. fulva]|nr:MAG: hypothetical protein L6R40_002460 [Xanthomendoza cf. fulva]